MKIGYRLMSRILFSVCVLSATIVLFSSILLIWWTSHADGNTPEMFLGKAFFTSLAVFFFSLAIWHVAAFLVKTEKNFSENGDFLL